MTLNEPGFCQLLEPFADFPELLRRVELVLNAIPPEVQQDFLEDPRFQTALHHFIPGSGTTVKLAVPGPAGQGSRCVALKPRLATSNERFALYVIAHEFAHAWLRNGGWGEILDSEEAADALAAHWGFEKPPRKFWPFPPWPTTERQET